MTVQSAQCGLDGRLESGRSKRLVARGLGLGQQQGDLLAAAAAAAAAVAARPDESPLLPQAARDVMPRPAARAIPARRVDRVVMLELPSVMTPAARWCGPIAESTASTPWRQALNSRNWTQLSTNRPSAAACRASPPGDDAPTTSASVVSSGGARSDASGRARDGAALEGARASARSDDSPTRASCPPRHDDLGVEQVDQAGDRHARGAGRRPPARGGSRGRRRGPGDDVAQRERRRASRPAPRARPGTR